MHKALAACGIWQTQPDLTAMSSPETRVPINVGAMMYFLSTFLLSNLQAWHEAKAELDEIQSGFFEVSSVEKFLLNIYWNSMAACVCRKVIWK